LKLNFFKLKKFAEGAEDCSKAIEIDSNNVKAYLRRATCNTTLEKWEEVVRDYERYFST
jgi:serine/threonine-protein phosphatase 5